MSYSKNSNMQVDAKVTGINLKEALIIKINIMNTTNQIMKSQEKQNRGQHSVHAKVTVKPKH
jgi:hypothetical protein